MQMHVDYCLAAEEQLIGPKAETFNKPCVASLILLFHELSETILHVVPCISLSCSRTGSEAHNDACTHGGSRNEKSADLVSVVVSHVKVPLPSSFVQ